MLRSLPLCALPKQQIALNHCTFESDSNGTDAKEGIQKWTTTATPGQTISDKGNIE
jgi:hypothetical protein